MSNSPKIVGRVSPPGRNPTSDDSAHGNVGLREETANPTYGDMAGEWKDITLGDFVGLQRGHDLTEPERRPGHVPVIGSAGQNGFHDTALAKGPGIVIGRSGASFGQVHFCATDYWPHNTGLYVTDFKGNDPRFAYYFLKALDFDRYNSGSAQPSLNRNFIYPIPICVPEPDEQKSIAHILGTLDDKIELNRRMNATLEAMARALFQNWFVDFDPVRAKLDGRKPAGLDAATAALFPAHFQDSTLGHIPQGWEVRSLDQIAHFLNGLALQKYPPSDGETLPVIKIAQLRKGDSAGADRCNTELAPQYIVEDGDVLFSWSGSLEVELWCGGQGALNQHLFKVTSPAFPKWFYYLWTLYHLDEFRLIAAGKATTMGHIQRGHLTAAKALVPLPDLLKAMTHIMAPLIDQIIANRTQSSTLATLRDALLPKLLSGEVSAVKATSEMETVT
jgi:type I restriction enzyme S subunit